MVAMVAEIIDKMQCHWTKEVIEKLNKFQSVGQFHPFTCSEGHTLIATENGWICKHCPDYHQYWFHDFMVMDFNNPNYLDKEIL
jgi:hypothetical protein